MRSIGACGGCRCSAATGIEATKRPRRASSKRDHNTRRKLRPPHLELGMIDLRREGCLLVLGAFLFIPSAIACDGSTYAVQQWHGMPSAPHVLQWCCAASHCPALRIAGCDRQWHRPLAPTPVVRCRRRSTELRRDHDSWWLPGAYSEYSDASVGVQAHASHCADCLLRTRVAG